MEPHGEGGPKGGSVSSRDRSRETVQAAGGVVVLGEGADATTALIHRPRYDDWSLPKGKLLPGERHEEAAVREVQEETGLRCRLGRFLGEVSYLDRSGKTKVVRYWIMHPVDQPGSFVPGDEVDQLRWVSLSDALSELSYAHDRELVEGLLNGGSRGHAAAHHVARSGPNGGHAGAVGKTTILLIRHAKAGVRSKWPGPDEERPLTARGRKQARRLVSLAREFPIRRVVSSPFARCVQTVEPLAAELGRPVESDDGLAEGAGAKPALSLIAELGDAALCTHRDVIDALLGALVEQGLDLEADRPTAKGSAWALGVEDGLVISGRHVPAASD
jgi:8-oxo-dGTP diphosphatase